jgi:hypothetical protein
MFPYQIYQALADVRTREGVAAARRRALVAEAIAGAASRQSGPATESWRRSMRLKGLTARMVALVTGRRVARSTTTTTSTAGPMGCVA